MNKATSKIIQALHSRTVWTMIVGLVFNILVPTLNLTPETRDFVNGVIVLIAGYFHLNPQQITVPAGSTATVTSPTTTMVTTTPPTPSV